MLRRTFVKAIMTSLVIPGAPKREPRTVALASTGDLTTTVELERSDITVEWETDGYLEIEVTHDECEVWSAGVGGSDDTEIETEPGEHTVRVKTGDRTRWQLWFTESG